jgi:predicted esterase
MNSWYDIVGLDERSNERCDGIEQSRSRIESILQKEHDDLGLPYSRMVLAGFSQGGALALFTGLQLGGGESAKAEKKVAGIVVLSGYLPCAKQFRISPGLEGTPIFHGQYVYNKKHKCRILMWMTDG